MNDHLVKTKCKVCTVKYQTEISLHGGQHAISLQKEFNPTFNCTNKMKDLSKLFNANMSNWFHILTICIRGRGRGVNAPRPSYNKYFLGKLVLALPKFSSPICLWFWQKNIVKKGILVVIYTCKTKLPENVFIHWTKKLIMLINWFKIEKNLIFGTIFK